MMYFRYLKLLLAHKWYVLQAGLETGVPFWRLLFHDWTKFLPVEFVNYAQWTAGKRDKQRWIKAWGHHQKRNPHHPEYWLLSWRGDPHYYDDVGHYVADFVTVLPMPETYVREMVADWLGASRAYTGSWNMSQWLGANGHKMLLHPETESLVWEILYEIGYFQTDGAAWGFMLSNDARLK